MEPEFDYRFDVVLDRVRGGLCGLAIGDAFGAQYERYSTLSSRLAQGYDGTFKFPVTTGGRWAGPKTGVMGQLTDDTEMALIIMRNVVRCGKMHCPVPYDAKSVIPEYLRWANKRDEYPACPFMGKNTRALFAGVTTIRGYETRRRKVIEEVGQENQSQSNGALMRCLPLAFLNDNITNIPIVEDCKITNPHPVTVECSELYGRIVRGLAIDGKSPDDVLDLDFLRPEQKANLDALGEAEALDDRNIADRNSKGWAPHALYATSYCLQKFGKNIPRILKWACYDNRGSDSDTVAAIACGAVGAWAGMRQLMADPEVVKLWEIVKNADPSKGAILRPKEYTLHDFDNLTLEFTQARTRV